MSTEQLYEAYLQVVNEAAEAKFKVGDVVGIGNHHLDYHDHDLGTVTKVNKFGHHTVEYHTRKSNDDESKPLVKTFDAAGKIRDPYAMTRIIPKAQHEALVKGVMDRQERSRDLHQVAQHLADHKLGSGHFAKLPKHVVAQMKELLDKHTEE